MIDDGEADDKIVAVLDKDPFWDETQDLADIPKALVERLVHYFSTYKLTPGNENRVSIVDVYDRHHARRVIEAAIDDYRESYELGASSLRF